MSNCALSDKKLSGIRLPPMENPPKLISMDKLTD